jgi:CubicO group peptidase (beta-lactamase class C family)
MKSIGSGLQDLLEKQLKAKGIFHAVIAVKSGKEDIDWAGAVGNADNVRGIQMTGDTPYFIASVTKMYTCALIMHLYEKNLLNLDDPISKHLPSSLIDGIHIYKGKDYADKLKIVHLLSHTSGLADYFLQKQKSGGNILDKIIKNGDYEWDINTVMGIVTKELTPKFKPGERGKASYSDTNYQLLGTIIESITEKTLAEAYDEVIFKPLKLRDTYLFDLSSLDSKPRPTQFYYNDTALDIPKAMTSFGPDGGIVSTARESLVFLKAFLNGALFSRDFLGRMKRWNKIFFPLEYGYGLMRFKLPRIMSPFKPAPELIGHSGSTASFSFYCPDEDLYLAGTLNQIKEQSRPFRLMIDVINAVR